MRTFCRNHILCYSKVRININEFNPPFLLVKRKWLSDEMMKIRATIRFLMIKIEITPKGTDTSYNSSLQKCAENTLENRRFDCVHLFISGCTRLLSAGSYALRFVPYVHSIFNVRFIEYSVGYVYSCQPRYRSIRPTFLWQQRFDAYHHTIELTYRHAKEAKFCIN